MGKRVLATMAVVYALTPLSLNAAERGFFGGRFALELDGSVSGFVASVSGSSEKLRRANGKEPLTIVTGMRTGSRLFSWVQSSLQGRGVKKSGVIHQYNRDYVVTHSWEFFGALITETKMPHSMDQARIR